MNRFIDKYQAREPFNTPELEGERMVCLAHPCGGETIYLCKKDVEPYNRDPDGFAAEHFGLTKTEYREWVIQEGHALCGARTKAGKPCRNFVSGHGTDPSDWKAANRRDFCGSHRYMCN